MKVLVVFGTRPEAIKLARVIHHLESHPTLRPVVCVTGQHREMLKEFLSLFQLRPAYNLDLMERDQSLSALTSRVLLKLEEVLQAERPAAVVVQGDTTTAFATALAAYYAKVPVAHVEAGLRTRDKYRPFPEELNRALIDDLADILFAPTESAKQNLLREGADPQKVFLSGNTVIDALRWVVDRLASIPEVAIPIEPTLRASLSKGQRRLLLVTGHRRESFGEGFKHICLALKTLAEKNPGVEIVYPVHLNPNVQEPVHQILGAVERVHLLAPLPYQAFVWLMSKAHLVLTDSGGVQEEAPALGKPVLVLRDTTERPEGIEAGVAKLVGTRTSSIVDETQRLLDNEQAYQSMAKRVDLYGDGRAAERITQVLATCLDGN